jgi:hypothetical protein
MISSTCAVTLLGHNSLCTEFRYEVLHTLPITERSLLSFSTVLRDRIRKEPRHFDGKQRRKAMLFRFISGSDGSISDTGVEWSQNETVHIYNKLKRTSNQNQIEYLYLSTSSEFTKLYMYWGTFYDAPS